MEILELNVRHFGKFLEYRVPLHEGVNIISGENETGKTTLHAFIRAMLYGIDTGRGRRGEEYMLRQPWDNPAYFAGAMRVRSEGKIWRIERSFYRQDRQLRVISETDGLAADDPEEKLREILCGMSEQAFLNTVFIPQGASATDEGLAEELQRYMINFQESMDGGLDVNEALRLLKSRRKELEDRRRETQGELDSRIRELETEIRFVQEELQREERAGGQTQVPETADPQGAGQIPQEPPRDRQTIWEIPDTEFPDAQSGRQEAPRDAGAGRGFYPVFVRGMTVLLGAGGILAAACGVLADTAAARILLFVIAAGMLALCGRTLRDILSDRRKDGSPEDPGRPVTELEIKRELQREQERERAARRERALERERLLVEKGKKEGAQQEKEEKKQSLTFRLHLLEQELEEQRRRADSTGSMQEELAALDLAADRIEKLSRSMAQQGGTRLGEEASGILEELTGGRYTKISLDAKGQVMISTPDRLLEARQVSASVADRAYLALRIAAGDILSGDGEMPLILDEPFAMYDDVRLKETMRYLSGTGRQVILFTCTGREQQALKEAK